MGRPLFKCSGTYRKYGPLLDRIDLHIEVNKVSYDELSGKAKGESSDDIRDRVVEARQIQTNRFFGINGVLQ